MWKDTPLKSFHLLPITDIQFSTIKNLVENLQEPIHGTWSEGLFYVRKPSSGWFHTGWPKHSGSPVKSGPLYRERNKVFIHQNISKEMFLSIHHCSTVLMHMQITARNKNIPEVNSASTISSRAQHTTSDQ